MAEHTGPDRKNVLVATAVATLGTYVATTAARRASRLAWRAVTGTPPPSDPRSPEIDWTVAILWAVASGAAVGIARLVVEREVNARILNRVE